MQRYHVCDEGITTYYGRLKSDMGDVTRPRMERTPGSHHIKIEQGRKCAEKRATRLESLDPAEEGKHEEEDGDCFIVIRACN